MWWNWKRVVLWGAVCLLAGSALNVLVAWGCVLWASVPLSANAIEGWAGGERDRPSGAPQQWGTPYRSRAWQGFGQTSHDNTWILWVDPHGSNPKSRVDHRGERFGERTLVIVRLTGAEAGWPRRSLRWQGGHPNDGCAPRNFPKLQDQAPRERPLFDTDRLNGFLGIKPGRLLPARPIPGGFVANTAAYAALVAMPGPTPLLVRRARRLRRGLCMRCGDPLGVSPVCTEYGAGLDHAAETAR